MKFSYFEFKSDVKFVKFIIDPTPIEKDGK